MTHTQKLIAIALFVVVYGLVVWIVYPDWLAYSKNPAARVNFQTCPLCEK